MTANAQLATGRGGRPYGSAVYLSLMNQAPVRQLCAIMFADIVGYTAMMQRSEADEIGRAHVLTPVTATSRMPSSA